MRFYLLKKQTSNCICCRDKAILSYTLQEKKKKKKKALHYKHTDFQPLQEEHGTLAPKQSQDCGATCFTASFSVIPACLMMATKHYVCTAKGK